MTDDSKKPEDGAGKVPNESLLKLLVAMQMQQEAPEPPKEMKDHRFWSTQPVVGYDEKTISDGPIKRIDPGRVSKDPPPLLEGFEWVTMDIADPAQLDEVYNLLEGHYVEDKDERFRFNYSRDFLRWALMPPGWEQHKDLHIGVRSQKTGNLLAFISGIAVVMRVRQKRLRCSDINFLCVHKKLRSMRLAPVLIAEVTRRSYRSNIFQGVYTAGKMLPTPIGVCRYYHRSLDWEKLYDIGFADLPEGETKEGLVAKYTLPSEPKLEGLREARQEDVDQIGDLIRRYLARADMAPEFTNEELGHWLIGRPKERVIWSYVVEAADGRITDFFSFYNLESTVIGHDRYKSVNVAYQYYYATEAAFDNDGADLKARLNELVEAELVLAKQHKFDVFNALTLLDNPLFLQEQLFGRGDGYLHYYMFNYRAVPIPGGIDKNKDADPGNMRGVGLIML